MSSFSVQALQEKLNRLTPSQDSIETLSLWMIHHKAYGKTSVTVWLENVQKGDPDRRLVLFYLANDVLQNARRRGADVFYNFFKDPLRQAVILVTGQKIQTSVERMFRIWKERKVYDNTFIKELENLIEPSQKPAVEDVPPEFKLPLLEDAVTELRKFEGELKVKSSHLSTLRIDVSNTASLSRLKDKSEGGRFSAEFEEASQKLQDYCECLGIEVNERINILDMLRECNRYHTHRLAELQRTAKDYKELGVVVEKVREKVTQRFRELERAQQTATSDPTAKEDITDVGDMEIDSDNDSQEGMDVGRTSLPPPQPPSLLQQPPHLPLPQSQPPLRPVMPPPSSAFMEAPPAPFQPPVFKHPLMPPPYHQPSSSYPPRPMMQGPEPRRMLRPPMPNAPPNSRQLPPIRFPPPHQIQNNRMPPPPPQQGPPTRNTITAPPMRYPLPPPASSTPTPTGPTATVTGISEPAETSSTNDVPPGDPLATSPTSAKCSLDERLKSLMTQKSFTKVILTEYSDSGSENSDSRERDGKDKPYSPFSQEMDMEQRPYSPSTADLPISNVGTPLDKDDDSIPTPTSGTETPEDASPGPLQLNMDNPILKALYRSPSVEQESSPQHKEAASVSSEAQQPQLSASLQRDTSSSLLISHVDTNLLQSILDNVSKTVSASNPQSATPNHLPSRPPSSSAMPVAQSAPPIPSQPSPTDRPAKSQPSQPQVKGAANLKDLKITPTLTNLLDEIFPRLSKSLQIERKRKQEAVGNSDEATPEASLPAKVPRVESSSNHPPLHKPPAPIPPPPHAQRPPFTPWNQNCPPMQPQFSPRPPGPNLTPPPRPMGPPHGAEMRPPRPMGPPHGAEMRPPQPMGLPHGAEMRPPQPMGPPHGAEMRPPQPMGPPHGAEMRPPQPMGPPHGAEMRPPRPMGPPHGAEMRPPQPMGPPHGAEMRPPRPMGPPHGAEMRPPQPMGPPHGAEMRPPQPMGPPHGAEMRPPRPMGPPHGAEMRPTRPMAPPPRLPGPGIRPPPPRLGQPFLNRPPHAGQLPPRPLPGERMFPPAPDHFPPKQQRLPLPANPLQNAPRPVRILPPGPEFRPPFRPRFM